MAENAIAVQEKPILFSGAMVRAVIEGRKTQTRRVAKPVRGFEHNNICKVGMPHAADSWAIWWHGAETDRVGCLQECPYGKPGDRLWVRETHYRWGHWEKNGKTDKGAQRWKFIALDNRVVFAATDTSKESPTHRGDDGWWKRPAIFLPRWASRLTLEIVSVKVERVQDISEADAIAEGTARTQNEKPVSWGGFLGWYPTARDGYRDLWNNINVKREGGKYSWEKNPWVWAIEFKKFEGPTA